MLTSILLNVLLAINLGHLVVTILTILVIVAVVLGCFYLFERLVAPIGNNIKGVVLFIILALLIIYAITNGGVIF